VSGHTPGPWTVRHTEYSHMKDSPLCVRECGAGKLPIRVARGSASWWGECETHVMRYESVEGIYAADGSTIAEIAQERDGIGYISQEDAPLIAAAPDFLAAAELAVLYFQRTKDAGGWQGYLAHEAWAALAKAIARAEGK
jgi:hypothetical protein